MKIQYTIYGLTDPRDQMVRYVGSTRRPLKRRLEAHLQRAMQEGETSDKNEWLLWLIRDNQAPGIVELESSVIAEHWETREQFWIEILKEQLTNSTAGGLGAKGMPAHVRAKISRALTGRKNPHQGHEWSLVSRKKASDSHINKTRPLLVREKVSDGLRRYHAQRKAAQCISI